MFTTALLLLVAVCISFQFNGATCNPIPSVQAFKFMKSFGYLERGADDSEALYSETAVLEAIKNVQKFGALPQTGFIDNATIKLMTSPRCGVPDIQRRSEFRRKRYIIAAKGWGKRNITYFVANWSPKIGEEAVTKYIQLALNSWGRYARLHFHRINDPSADIIVAFGRGPHGDGYPFDGPNNILAHAFFPYEQGSLGGDIHFDDDENWRVNLSQSHAYEDGIDFFTVAVHELGHSLGLGHSPVSDSIMFPYYKGYTSNFALSYDDILAVYQLYIQRHLDGDEKIFSETGESTSTSTTSTSTDAENEKTPSTTSAESTTSAVTDLTYAGDDETVDEHRRHEGKETGNDDVTPVIATTTAATNLQIPDVCNGNFDAVALLRGELFIFIEKYVWRVKEKGIIEAGYPIVIQELFPTLPESVDRIDAAYERTTDGFIILFTGQQYWISDGNDFIGGSPRPLTDYGLPAILDRIDAAQVWRKNGKTYLYRGELFWRYNETSRHMDAGYPHHIKRWRGVPAHLNAATTWTDGFTYFFKGRLFWKFDNHFIRTDEHYPLPAPQTWLGCPENMDTIWWLPPDV